MEERNWRWTDGYLLTWANWMDAKPNGDTSENCMIRLTSGEWEDDRCSGSYQFYCETVTGFTCLNEQTCSLQLTDSVYLFETCGQGTHLAFSESIAQVSPKS